jgi:hypothetical protein
MAKGKIYGNHLSFFYSQPDYFPDFAWQLPTGAANINRQVFFIWVLVLNLFVVGLLVSRCKCF